MYGVCYRLYTENKNREGFETLIGKFFQSFSIFEGVGYWEGQREDCLMIEVIDIYGKNEIEHEEMKKQIQRLGTAIAFYNTQNQVMITRHLVTIL